MGYTKGLKWALALVMVLHKHVQSVNYLHFDDCKKPANEGKIYIHKNATWLECKNRVLERYCIAERKDGELHCVPHERVKARLDDYAKGWFTGSFARPFYAVDTEQKYANCSKIQDEKKDTLQNAVTKKDCLGGRQKLNTVSAKNIYCTMTDNNVYYIEDNDWYKCKNGAFHLQRCVQKIGEKQYCLSTQKILSSLESSNKLSTFNRRMGTFCEEFFKNPKSYMPNYKNKMEVCSDFNEAEPAPTPYVPPPPPSKVVPTPPPPRQVTEAPYVPPPPVETEAPYVAPLPAVTEASYVPPPPVKTEAPYVPPKPVTRAPPPPRRRVTTKRPYQRRRATTPKPTTRRPKIIRRRKYTTYCRIKSGWQYGKCFDPKKAAERMMDRPIGETFNRPDKLLGWGQMTVGDFLGVLETGRQAYMKNDRSGMSIVEAVQKASGMHKCDVITQKLPINDAIYNDIATRCICNRYRRCY